MTPTWPPLPLTPSPSTSKSCACAQAILARRHPHPPTHHSPRPAFKWSTCKYLQTSVHHKPTSTKKKELRWCGSVWFNPRSFGSVLFGVLNTLTVLLLTVLPPPHALCLVLDGRYLTSTISFSRLSFMLTVSIAVFACYPNLDVVTLPYYPRCTGESCVREGKNNTRQFERIYGFCMWRECLLTRLRLCSMTERTKVYF